MLGLTVACSSGSGDSPPDAAPAEGGAEEPQRVEVAGVTVSYDGSTSEGTLEVSEASDPADLADLVVGPVIDARLSTGSQATSAVELRFPDSGGDWIARWDPGLGMWLPINTEVDSGELVAVVDRFSLWTTISDRVGRNASWFDHQSSRWLAGPAPQPACSGSPPEWVTGFSAPNDADAALFACGESAADQLVVRVANNRPYPVTVQFNQPLAAPPETDLPDTAGQMVQQITDATSPSRSVFLLGASEAVVRFARPLEQAGQVTVHAHRDLHLPARVPGLRADGLRGARHHSRR